MKKGIFLAAPRLVTLESNFISYSFETLVTNFPGEHFDGSRPRFRFCLVSGNFEASRLMGPNRILSFDLATKINLIPRSQDLLSGWFCFTEQKQILVVI